VINSLVTPLLPFIREEFALDYTRAGLVLSAFSLSYGISQLPAGWLADRIGPRILITIGISGVALAGLLVGLSQTYMMLIIFLALMGVMGGGYHPSAVPLISASVDPKVRGRVLGMHTIGGSASFFLSPLIAAAIAGAWGWRTSFIGLAIPTIAFGIILYTLLGRRADTAKTEREIPSSDTKTASTPGHVRRLVPFLILSIAGQALMYSTISFTPLYLVDHFGVGKEQAAKFLPLIFSAGLWAAPLGGYLSDRWGRIPVILGVCLMGGPAVYLLNLVPYGSHGVGIGILLVIIGMITYIRMPVAEAYIVGQTPQHRRSSILGIYYFCTMEAGGVVTPVAGYMIDRFGFYTNFTIVAAILVAVTIICGIFLWGRRE